MLMYGVYNTETLEKLIDMVHQIHNTASSHGKIVCRTTELMNTQVILCKCTRFTALFNKITTLFKNSTGQIHCFIQVTDNSTAYGNGNYW